MARFTATTSNSDSDDEKNDNGSDEMDIVHYNSNLNLNAHHNNRSTKNVKDLVVYNNHNHASTNIKNSSNNNNSSYDSFDSFSYEEFQEHRRRKAEIMDIMLSQTLHQTQTPAPTPTPTRTQSLKYFIYYAILLPVIIILTSRGLRITLPDAFQGHVDMVQGNVEAALLSYFPALLSSSSDPVKSKFKVKFSSNVSPLSSSSIITKTSSKLNLLAVIQPLSYTSLLSSLTSSTYSTLDSNPSHSTFTQFNIFTGPGGTGKSHTARAVLNGIINNDDDDNDGDDDCIINLTPNIHPLSITLTPTDVIDDYCPLLQTIEDWKCASLGVLIEVPSTASGKSDDFGNVLHHVTCVLEFHDYGGYGNSGKHREDDGDGEDNGRVNSKLNALAIIITTDLAADHVIRYSTQQHSRSTSIDTLINTISRSFHDPSTSASASTSTSRILTHLLPLKDSIIIPFLPISQGGLRAMLASRGVEEIRGLLNHLYASECKSESEPESESGTDSEIVTKNEDRFKQVMLSERVVELMLSSEFVTYFDINSTLLAKFGLYAVLGRGGVCRRVGRDVYKGLALALGLGLREGEGSDSDGGGVVRVYVSGENVQRGEGLIVFI